MILITGCAGYIGSRLAQAILADGKGVAGIALPGEEQSLAPLISQGLKVFYHDITEDGFLENWFDDIEVIYHLAGVHSSIAKMRRLYIDGTRNILQLAKKYECPCLIAGNSAIYHESNQLLTEDAIDLSTVPMGSHPFGMITYEMERLSQSFYEADRVPVVVLRIAQVYGDDTMKTLLHKLASGSHTLLGTGDNYQSFIHIEDLMKIMKDFYRKLKPGQAYNITDDLPVRQKEYYRRLAEHFKVPLPLRIPDWEAGERIRLSIHGLKALSIPMSNAKLKQCIDDDLLYPTFLDGLKINNKLER